MPRKFKSTAQYQKPDPKYGSRLISKFINAIMLDGKKSTAQRVMYDALELVQKRVPEVEPLEVFTKAVENLKPQVEVRSKRVGGATYQVPMQVKPGRQLTLSLRWLLDVCRKKKGRPLGVRLADEIVAAYRREGAAYTIRENVHKMADANKAFAHFAW